MTVVLNNISPPIVHHSISPHMMHQRHSCNHKQYEATLLHLTSGTIGEIFYAS